MSAKTLLIGLDSLDPDIFEAMMNDGAMPTAAALAKKAKRRRIENYDGLGAGAFWPSMATGAKPGEHGRSFRMQFDPQTYAAYFRDDARDMPVDSFWARLDRQGFRCAVIDWSHGPVAPLPNGLVVNDWLSHEAAGAFIAYPDAAGRTIERDYGLDPWRGSSSARLPETAEGWRDFVKTAIARIERKTRYCVDRLRENDWDLFAPTFSEAHDIGHYAFHIVDRRHFAYDAALAEAVGDPMRAICQAFDSAIAAIVEAAGPDAAVMLTGGPGMTALVTANPMMELIARRLDCGVGRAAQTLERAQSAYRSIAPLWLRRAASPLTRRMMRRPPELPELASRRFFAVLHTDNSGCIRINLKGREAHGVIEPGAEYDALVEQISRDLMDIRDADTGEPIVEQIVAARRAYPGPRADDLPDIFAIWRREKPIRRIASPKIGVIKNEPVIRTGDHTPFGFLWLDGRSPWALDDRAALRPHEASARIEETVRRVRLEETRAPA